MATGMTKVRASQSVFEHPLRTSLFASDFHKIRLTGTTLTLLEIYIEPEEDQIRNMFPFVTVKRLTSSMVRDKLG